jgi:hypothetical protein
VGALADDDIGLLILDLGQKIGETTDYLRDVGQLKPSPVGFGYSASVQCLLTFFLERV